MVVNICCLQALLPGDEFPAVEIPERRGVRSVACRETSFYDTCICTVIVTLC